MKKLFLVSGAILIFLFFFYLFISGFKKPSTTQNPEGNTKISPVPLNQQSNKKINISGVKTDNFLAKPIRESIDGAVLFLKTGNVEAVYYKKYNQFNLVVSSSSEQTRNLAEEEFIKKLGITKQDACRLDVVVNSPYVPNSYLALPKKELSFCVE